MVGLAQCVQARGRERHVVGAERVGGIRLGFGDGLAARPGARRILRRDRRYADFALSIDDRGPFALAREETARIALDTRGGTQELGEVIDRRKIATFGRRPAGLRCLVLITSGACLSLGWTVGPRR